jgi:hypothetical protein
LGQGRRKYLFTDQIDRLIREIYLGHPDAKTRPGIRMLAKKMDVPHWALRKRARELGLARTKELPWSEPELQILSRYACMSDERIRLKLKAAGYSRTVTGIHLKLRRMKFKNDPGFYSAISLAQALGIDSHAVSRWIRRGHLEAELRDTGRGEKQNGNIYLIREKDVRRFILEHPMEIDLRKVDQLWFSRSRDQRISSISVMNPKQHDLEHLRTWQTARSGRSRRTACAYQSSIIVEEPLNQQHTSPTRCRSSLVKQACNIVTSADLGALPQGWSFR